MPVLRTMPVLLVRPNSEPAWSYMDPLTDMDACMEDSAVRDARWCPPARSPPSRPHARRDLAMENGSGKRQATTWRALARTSHVTGAGFISSTWAEPGSRAWKTEDLPAMAIGREVGLARTHLKPLLASLPGVLSSHAVSPSSSLFHGDRGLTVHLPRVGAGEQRGDG